MKLRQMHVQVKYFILLSVITTLLSNCSFNQEEDLHYNIVLIMTDDQGYGDLSYHGNPILRTPHIDQLANQSVKLNNYHSATTCSPGLKNQA